MLGDFGGVRFLGVGTKLCGGGVSGGDEHEKGASSRPITLSQIDRSEPPFTPHASPGQALCDYDDTTTGTNARTLPDLLHHAVPPHGGKGLGVSEDAAVQPEELHALHGWLTDGGATASADGLAGCLLAGWADVMEICPRGGSRSV